MTYPQLRYLHASPARAPKTIAAQVLYVLGLAQGRDLFPMLSEGKMCRSNALNSSYSNRCGRFTTGAQSIYLFADGSALVARDVNAIQSQVIPEVFTLRGAQSLTRAGLVGIEARDFAGTPTLSWRDDKDRQCFLGLPDLRAYPEGDQPLIDRIHVGLCADLAAIDASAPRPEDKCSMPWFLPAYWDMPAWPTIKASIPAELHVLIQDVGDLIWSNLEGAGYAMSLTLTSHPGPNGPSHKAELEIAHNNIRSGRVSFSRLELDACAVVTDLAERMAPIARDLGAVFSFCRHENGPGHTVSMTPLARWSQGPISNHRRRQLAREFAPIDMAQITI